MPQWTRSLLFIPKRERAPEAAPAENV